MNKSKYEIDINYERATIPEYLINECNHLSKINSNTYFLFDLETKNTIKQLSFLSKSDEINLKLERILLSDDKYYIGTEYDFKLFPSRFSYYDTETKLIDRYKRYNFVVEFLEKLNFTKSEFNFGPEHEQTYTLNLSKSTLINKFILRLQPNLFFNLTYHDNNSICILHKGFFNKSIILNILRKYCPKDYYTIIRDFKISQIFDLDSI